MSSEHTFPIAPSLGAAPDASPARTGSGLFEDLVASSVRPARRGLGWLLPFSVVVHAVLGTAALVLPLLGQEPLPEPQDAVRAFLVTSPPVAAPPPPPPPPAPSAARVSRSVAPPRPADPAMFVAPIEVPDALEAEVGLDLGIEGGVAGGVEGGVPGGVVGGVVGGLPEAPPPAQAVRVGGGILPPKKLRDTPPAYPEIARQAGIQGVVILECTISPAGRVMDVEVLRGLPLLDESAIEAVKQWVYSPTLVDGVPVPVIMTVTVQFKLSGAPRGR